MMTPSALASDSLCGIVAFLSVVALLHVFGIDILNDKANARMRDMLVASTAYFSTIFFASRQLECFSRPKARAWIITVACALPVGITSSIYTFIHARNGFLLDMKTFIYGEPSNYSTGVVLSFLAFLATDTAFGMASYRAQFDPVAGWFHHIAYSIFFASALRYKFANGLASAMPLELTTIVLGLGHIWPQLRADLLFGVSFILLRIIYHGFMTVAYFTMRADVTPASNVWSVMLLAFGLHLHWFVGWLKQQRRLVRAKSKQRA